ncbi:MAG: hypothetical protein FJW69_00180 [Actinobacteria bacterium]|nr:hypothetical protein [Actinomycetota bacterium]
MKFSTQKFNILYIFEQIIKTTTAGILFLIINKLFEQHLGVSKTCNLFPSGEICSVSGFALLLKEEPCPLKPSKGFLNIQLLFLAALFFSNTKKEMLQNKVQITPKK